MDFDAKLAQLEQFVYQNKIPRHRLSRVYDMLYRKGKNPKQDGHQNPSCYIQDDLAFAWHDSSLYGWVPLLEESYHLIKCEALSIFQKKTQSVHPENDQLVESGQWNTFFLFKNGVTYTKNHEMCPITSRIVSQISGTDIAGRTYFSEMTGGTHVGLHCGPHNFKLRTQLGLVIPTKSFMTVSEEKRYWKEGKCFVFDDSFEHEAFNCSSESRIILIVDVWNQTLSHEEIRALIHVMPEFYSLR